MPIELDAGLRDRLASVRRVAVLTGPGVAAESQVPTFEECQVGKFAHYTVTELATAEGFTRNPRLVWEWYAYRRKLLTELQPSAAHYALVDLEQLYDEFLLITQNIDGLHWRAGSRELLELHGNIERARCFECGAYVVGWDDEGSIPPLCPYDGGYLRPDVVWLGEGISQQFLQQAYTSTQQAELFLSIGASAEVQPTATLPLIAKRAGAFVIEINPQETAMALMADYWLPYRPGEVLPLVARTLLQQGKEEA